MEAEPNPPRLSLLLGTQPSHLEAAVGRDEANPHEAPHAVRPEQVVDALRVVVLVVVGVRLVAHALDVCLQAVKIGWSIAHVFRCLSLILVF